MKEQSTENLHKEEVAPYKQCLNCGTDLQGVYCHKCGQQASNPTPKVWEFILEYMNNAFIWDTKCFLTIWNLVRRPGFLTNEFNAGKFVSYENPLKLNMFFLFVFVTIFLLFSDMQKANKSFDDFSRGELVRPFMVLNALNEDADYSAKMKESERDTIQLAVPLEDATKFPEIIAIHRAMTDYQHVKLDTLVASVPKVLIQDKILECNGSDVYSFSERNDIVDQTFDMNIWNKLAQKLMEIWTQYFPLIFLLTSPLLAFAVKLLHLKRKKPFISYFIFALHYTAFIELMLLVIYLLYLTVEPSFDMMQWVMTVSSGLYLTVAVRNVYEHHSWFKSIWKAFFISLNYLMICLVLFCVIFVLVTFAVIMSEMT